MSVQRLYFPLRSCLKQLARREDSHDFAWSVAAPTFLVSSVDLLGRALYQEVVGSC